VPLAAGSRLGPYEVVSLLGAGGMGEVYKARDTRLDRLVAIKIVASGIDDATVRERLMREARAASALNHPHICTIHDVGEQDGRPFIAMEWIDGETLAARLVRAAGRLPLDDTLRLATHIADALDAAHASGIVHRDLKPANLFITRRGDAKVLDFGLAKALALIEDAQTVVARRHLTEAGTTVGTVAYMAPEQARGEPVDARSDLFSFGVVLYEMATGRSPFAGATTALTFDAILNRQPPAARSGNAAIPPALDAIIGRLLAKDRASRPASARAIRDELQALQEESRRDRSSGAARIVPSLAVLPFTNLSPEPENEYIADGITEEIINTLAQIKGLQVAARTSSFSFKGKTPDLADVAAKLHVAHVVTGSVRKAGPRLRITVQLVNVADGFPIWSERYDREAVDIFEIQDAIAAAIAQKLRVTLTALDEPIAKRPTDNLDAYELYLKGRFLVNQRGAALFKGLECFEQALVLDRDYAPAHAGIATANALLGLYGYLASYEVMPTARRAVLNALDADPSLAEAHAAYMLILWIYDWDWERGEREFHRTITLDQRHANAYAWHSLHLTCHGRFEESIANGRRALEVDPLSASVHSVLAASLLTAERFDEARTAAERSLELDPGLWNSLRFEAMALHALGRVDDAIDRLKHAIGISNRHPWTLLDLADVLAQANHVGEAIVLVDEIHTRAASQYVSPQTVAAALVSVHRRGEAAVWLERAYRERDTSIPMFTNWPFLSSFSHDPIIGNILGRIGLSRVARSKR